MKPTFPISTNASPRRAFSLVEVVLAVGIFAVSIIALLGMLAPILRNVGNVVDTTEATAVVQKVNAYLQEADFTEIYTNVEGGRIGVLTVIRYRDEGDETNPLLTRVVDTTGTFDDPILSSNIGWSEGNTFKVLYKGAAFQDVNTIDGSTIQADSLPAIDQYAEAFLPLEIEIYLMPPLSVVADVDGSSALANTNPSSMELQVDEIFSYHTAIVR